MQNEGTLLERALRSGRGAVCLRAGIPRNACVLIRQLFLPMACRQLNWTNASRSLAANMLSATAFADLLVRNSVFWVIGEEIHTRSCVFADVTSGSAHSMASR